MRTEQRYDVVVIGAGAMGSAAAYHLAGDGRRVLLAEQFQIGHTNGSSHGGSRIIRYAHREAVYTRLIPQTLALWRQLEAESGAHLLQLTGGLYIGPPDEPFLVGAQTSLGALNHPFRMLTPTQVTQEFPQFRLPSNYLALFQAQSGILAAGRCVATLVQQAVRRGVDLLEQTRVLAVEPSGDGVAVQLAGPGTSEIIYADQAIVTAGPWAQRLLGPLLPATLPLTVTHQQVTYFAVEQPELYAVGRCPLYIFTAIPHFYGFPIFEMPGHIKIGLELIGSQIDPDAERVADQAGIDEVSAAVAEMMVGLAPRPASIDFCLYTETPTRDFIIDRHPAHPQILFATGFSGRGFKFSIGIGRLVADLAASAPGDYHSDFWLPNFALQNFVPSAG